MVNVTSVKLYQKVSTKAANGQIINTFPVVTQRFDADVQSARRTKEESYRWGQTDLAADSKIIFFDPNASVRMLDRIVDSQNRYYEVKGVNPWPIHYEALLAPVPGEIAPVAVDGIAVAPTASTKSILATLQLVATFTPVAPTNQAVAWGTSNAAIATVSTSGLVTAVSVGVATITVTSVDGGFTATCIVTVVP
jgi:Bacterial Ig-like domain (group 2)